MPLELYYPFKTIDIKEPVKLIERQVNRGDTITYITEYNKYIDKDAVLLVQLYNIDKGYYVSLSSEHTNVIPGKSVALKTVKIPETVCPGNYKIIITIKYTINALRTIDKRFISEVFFVK